MNAVEDELISVRDWLRHAATCFGRAELHYGHGTLEAWDEACALVLGWLRLPADRAPELLDARLTRDERLALAAAIRRRVEERVPVPYLTGEAWFRGVPFHIEPGVLIPRSPLGELLDGQLQPWLGPREPRRILDLCTGSGCIGILAAMRFEQARVDLADNDPAALALARRNLARHELAPRVQVIASDVLDGISDRYDLVLCNPPYVDAEDLAAMPPEYGHEPRAALAAGPDGMDFVARLFEALPPVLDDDGLLVLEVGASADALAARWPRLQMIWAELEDGGGGVAVIEARALRTGA